MNGFVLVDDTKARGFEPFALTRPAGELRAGALLIRERWESALGMRCAGFIAGAHLDAFEEFDAPRAATGVLPPGTLLVNARAVPALPEPGARSTDAARGSTIACGGRTAAVRLDAPVEVTSLRDSGAACDRLLAIPARGEGSFAGWWIDEVWDLLRHLNAMLDRDALALGAGAMRGPAPATVIGEHPFLVEDGATIEPHVVVDTGAGPVLVRRGATVLAFTRLVGPCIIGRDAHVGGGKVASCSIGEKAKVHGELNSTIFIGHANKGHDGFVGHSIVGRWANLGAGTITSNLKNSYGSVALWTPGGQRDTGLQFLGSLIGDHAKLGIGTRLTTGCVVGAGANVFGGAVTPKVIAPFAWGEEGAFETFALDKFLVVAERVMARRDVKLGAGARAQLASAHGARWRA